MTWKDREALRKKGATEETIEFIEDLETCNIEVLKDFIKSIEFETNNYQDVVNIYNSMYGDEAKNIPHYIECVERLEINKDGLKVCNAIYKHRTER